MLTKISKILVVFVTFASIAFLAFSIIVTTAGPNWQKEAEALPDYTFTQSGGEKPTWSVRHRLVEQPLKTSVAYPDVIAEAYKHAKIEPDEAIAKYPPLIEKAKNDLAMTKQLIEVDVKGLEARKTELFQQYDAQQKLLADTSDALIKAGEATLKLRVEAERRRSDSYRLGRNLQAIEADHFQLIEQKQRILDLIFQMQGMRDRLRERANDLTAAGGADAGT